MTDLEALHRTILENPDDDTPRLIYADALEDAGESERAEFVRVQVELARSARPCPQGIANAEVGYKSPHSCFICSGNGGMIYDCDNPKEIRRRERELLRDNGGTWLNREGLSVVQYDFEHGQPIAIMSSGQMVGSLIQLQFSRGFISAITCSWSDFQRHAPSLLWWPARKCPTCNGTKEVENDTGGNVGTKWCNHCRGTGELPGGDDGVS